MKRFKVLAYIVVLFVGLSSFGVVENNKYIKAKIEQEAAITKDFNKKILLNDVLILQPEIAEADDEVSASLAQKVGDFVVGLVKRSFRMALNFFINLIK